MKIHYVYQLKHKETREFYIGCRSASDAYNDDYWGSGRTLIEKYPTDRKLVFFKEIIKVFEDRTDALRYERELIKQMISNAGCLNGSSSGGNMDWFGRRRTTENCDNLSRALSGRKGTRLGKKSSEITKKKLSDALKGRTFSEETRKKMSEKRKGKSLTEEAKEKLREFWARRREEKSK